MGYRFVWDINRVLFQFDFSPEFVRKFKTIPQNLRLFDIKLGCWIFEIDRIPDIAQYIEIPLDIMERYHQYITKKRTVDLLPEFMINVDTTYSQLKILKAIPNFNPQFLSDVCSFEVKGAKYTDAYKKGEWDGIYHLFNTTTFRFPTGLLQNIIDALNVEMYEYKLNYLTPFPSFGQYHWQIQNIDFRDYQNDAIQSAIQNKRGILQLATGAGKTTLSVGIIQQFGLKTLFLVHTKDLLYQAYKVFKRAFNMPIGLIGDGNCQIGDITVATIQTLSPKINDTEQLYGDWNYDIEQEYDEETIEVIRSEKPTTIDTTMIDNLLQNTKLLFFDECLVGNTLIQLNNGNFIPIQMICNNDKIIGGKVSNIFQKEVNYIIKIETSFGILKTSEHHPNLIIDKLPFSNNQFQNPLEKDICIKKSNELQIGNYLLIPDQIDHPNIQSKYSFDMLYFIAFVLGDGHLDKQGNRVKFEFHKQEKINIIKPLFEKLLYQIDNSISLQCKILLRKIKNKDYNVILLWCNSNKFKTILINEFQIPIGKKSNVIDITENIILNNLSDIKGFIQGCFDCEGWVNIINKRIGIQYNSLIFIQKLQLLLLKFRIKSKLYERKRNIILHNTSYMLDITGIDLIQYINVIGTQIPSKKEKMDWLLQNIPNRTYNHYVYYKNIKYVLSKIKSIEYINEKTIVYDFTTDTHTFIANGFLTHNCQHIPSKTFYKIAMKCPSPYRFGLSATPFRDDGFDMKIQAGLGKIVYKLSASDLIKRGYLIQPHIKCIQIPRMVFPRKATYNQIYKEYIVDNTIRNDVIASLAQSEEIKNHQILILVKQIRHLNGLHGLIPQAVCIDGTMGGTEREQILGDFKERKFHILIATTLADEGLDVPTLDILILAGSGKSITKALQRVGRVIRLGDICPSCRSTDVRIKSIYDRCICNQCHITWAYHGKTTATVYDFIDQTKYVYDHYLKRLEMYQTESEFEVTKHKINIKE